MPSDNSILRDHDSDVFGLIILIWENKGLMSIIIALSILIGSTSYYFSDSLMAKRVSEIFRFFKLDSEIANYEKLYSIKANIYIKNNQFFPKEIMIKKFNDKFTSAHNYVEWSNTNKNLSGYLPRSTAYSVRLNPAFNIVVTENIDLKETVKAMASYLSYTNNIINDDIYEEIKIIYNTKIEDQKKKIRVLKKEIDLINFRRGEKIQPLELNILNIDNDILNANIKLKNAEKQLDYINNNIAPETFKTKNFILLRVELTNAINNNKLIIQNLKDKKESYNHLIETADKELIDLDFNRNELQNKLNIELDNLKNETNNFKELENMQLTQLGEVKSKSVTNKISNIHIIKILVICFIIGLIMGIFILLLKREFIRRKQIFKL